MKLVYITSQKYPSAKVDPVEMRSTAEALSGILGKDFLFLVRGDIPKDLRHINVMSARVPQRLRIIFYFFLLPTLVIIHKWNDPQTVIFSQDPYLLAILIFWRRILRFQYLICSDWRQLFDDWRDNYVAKGSDLLVTTSKRLMSLLLFRCDISQEKILTAYGGVNKDIFEEKARKSKLEHRKGLGLPTEAFLVGYVGGFRSVGMEKGIDTMIKSLPFLGKKIMMIFVGGSKQVINEYVLLAMKEKVEDRCIFIEKQSFDKVIEYEMAMDILVIPYPDKPHFRDYGFPLKVWEYMASGRPIIYSDLEIIKEVLEKRADSFQPDNVSSLAGVISSVYQNIELAEKVAKQNPEDVHAYTYKARAINILNFIQDKKIN
jgi:glycosyltransferase involved in cell wall biosynthesis